MSWPSSYGYKYTPIGLRQREKRDELGKRFICTTVHLPEGGHLLEIDREYGIDGSMSKRETQNMSPSSLTATRPVPPTRGASPQPSAIADFFEPRPTTSPSDFERAADDIIANFRARHGTGLDDSLQSSMEAIQRLEDTYGKYSCGLRREASASAAAATAGETKATLSSTHAALRASETTEETSEASRSSRVRRMLKNAGSEY